MCEHGRTPTMKIQTAVGVCVLKRSRRRTLAISVLPDGTVEAIAPMDAELPKIREKIEKRAGWIARQRRHFATLHSGQSVRRYCTGATHRYLGRQYRLKVMTGDAQGVKLRGAYLCVVSKTGSDKSVAALLSGWMRGRAKEQLEKRVEQWSPWCKNRNLPLPKVQLLYMSKRWGSASRSGRLAFNPELIRAPSVCVDYVIAHEMCHIKHPRHDAAFYSELDKLFKNWKSIKQRLESFDH